jgi:hypothetical protein
MKLMIVISNLMYSCIYWVLENKGSMDAVNDGIRSNLIIEKITKNNLGV